MESFHQQQNHLQRLNLRNCWSHGSHFKKLKKSFCLSAFSQMREVPSVVGIFPKNLFLETLRSSNCKRVPTCFGKASTKLPLLRSSRWSISQLTIAGEICPVSKWDKILEVTNSKRFPISFGNSDVKLLFARGSLCNHLQFAMSGGIGPLNLFWYDSTPERFTNLHISKRKLLVRLFPTRRNCTKDSQFNTAIGILPYSLLDSRFNKIDQVRLSTYMRRYSSC